MSKIDEAVSYWVAKINQLQQCRCALSIIINAISRNYSLNIDDLNNSIALIRGKLHEQICEAWESLYMLAPVSDRAKKLATEKTKKWFENETISIMHLLMGKYTSYAEKDEKEFRKEVLEMFNIKEKETK